MCQEGRHTQKWCHVVVSTGDPQTCLNKKSTIFLGYKVSTALFRLSNVLDLSRACVEQVSKACLLRMHILVLGLIQHQSLTPPPFGYACETFHNKRKTKDDDTNIRDCDGRGYYLCSYAGYTPHWQTLLFLTNKHQDVSRTAKEPDLADMRRHHHKFKYFSAQLLSPYKGKATTLWGSADVCKLH